MNPDRTWQVVYLEVVPPDIEDIIASRLPPKFDLRFIEDYSDNSAIDALKMADFVLVATHPLPARLVKAGRKLKMIQHQGVGYDKTDVKFAEEQGIPVALCPEGTIDGVAEHVFLLILSLYKQIIQADSSLRMGEWRQFSMRSNSFEIAGKNFGVIGLGRIGEAVVRRALSFEAKVSYYDINRRPVSEELALDVTYKPLMKLLQKSDIISLHLPLTPETHHIIDANALGHMKEGSLLINTARGNLIDQKALVSALEIGHLGGAGLDVFEQEPPFQNDPLLHFPNVVLTPHVAAGTRDALITKMDAAFANMVRLTQGEPPLHVVEI